MIRFAELASVEIARHLNLSLGYDVLHKVMTGEVTEPHGK
jgi:hypothetical protein